MVRLLPVRGGPDSVRLLVPDPHPGYYLLRCSPGPRGRAAWKGVAGGGCGEDDREMSSTPAPEILEPFLAAADTAAESRPDVDAETARELMAEAARMLHDGLVLDHLDEHDLELAAAALAADLTSTDPGAAVRARAAGVTDDEPLLHDPAGVRGAYLVSAQVLGL
jgi:hypothetical protein